MRGAYRTLAYTVVVLVAVQAAAIAWAVTGLGIWIEDGGVLDTSVIESEEIPFDEVAGFMVHGLNGMFLIPLVALALLAVSFGAHVRRGTAGAGLLLGLVVLQVALGIYGSTLALSGLLHGLNALLLFAVALHLGHLARRDAPPVPARERIDVHA